LATVARPILESSWLRAIRARDRAGARVPRFGARVDIKRVYVLAKPVAEVPANAKARRALVLFFEGRAELNDVAERAKAPEDESGGESLRELKQELELTQGRLRTMREESEAANEELYRERGAAIDQRGIPLHRRGTRNQQGGAAVDQRGAADRQHRTEAQARNRGARGGVFLHIINGQLMAVLIDDDPKSTNQLAGLFGLEIENVTKVSARNIWVRKLN